MIVCVWDEEGKEGHLGQKIAKEDSDALFLIQRSHFLVTSVIYSSVINIFFTSFWLTWLNWLVINLLFQESTDRGLLKQKKKYIADMAEQCNMKYCPQDDSCIPSWDNCREFITIITYCTCTYALLSECFAFVTGPKFISEKVYDLGSRS